MMMIVSNKVSTQCTTMETSEMYSKGKKAHDVLQWGEYMMYHWGNTQGVFQNEKTHSMRTWCPGSVSMIQKPQAVTGSK